MITEAAISEIPSLDLNAQFRSIRHEVKEAIDKVLESQYFIMGSEVKDFEKKIAEYCETDHAIGCASGSDALLLSLMALDIEPGDAVITTPFTFFATAGAIVRLGATPVFLDIDPVSYNINPEQVQLFLTGEHPLNKQLDVAAEDVRAIIPVHLYGQMADMDSLIDIAQEYDISIIEDAAQAIGAEYKGRRAGSVGDFGCFSFFPSKNLGGYGDGGLVTTNNAKMADKLSVLRMHGAKPKYHHGMVGINSRLDALQAAVLKVKLQYLDEWSDTRREKALTYNRLFQEAGLAGNSENSEVLERCARVHENDYRLDKFGKKIFLPEELFGDPRRGGRHVYHQYVVGTGQRQQIIEALELNNIGYSIYYPIPLHEQQCFAGLKYDPADCPVAHCASKTTLALPIYPELTRKQQQFIVSVIKETLS